jgi:hypothetical protein
MIRYKKKIFNHIIKVYSSKSDIWLSMILMNYMNTNLNRYLNLLETYKIPIFDSKLTNFKKRDKIKGIYIWRRKYLNL